MKLSLPACLIAISTFASSAVVACAWEEIGRKCVNSGRAISSIREIESDKTVSATVSEAIKLIYESGGFFSGPSFTAEVPEGPVSFEKPIEAFIVKFNNSEYLTIPALIQRSTAQQPDPVYSVSDSTYYEGTFRHTEEWNFALANIETGEIAPATLSRARCSGCVWEHWVFRRKEEMTVAGSINVDISRSAASIESEQAAQIEAQNAPKRAIGTRLCRSETNGGEPISTGFTEAVSPDNGRIQIRIASGPSKGDIIWDEPSRWSLCAQ